MRRSFLTRLIAILLLSALPAAAQITQERATVSAGGGTLTTPPYTLTGSIGQVSPVGTLGSATYTLHAGVWVGKSFVLSVVLAGPGSGTVNDCVTDETCAGTRIHCGSDCLEFYTDGESVLLRAFPDAGSAFGGWLVNGESPNGGALYMTRDVTVTAIFIGEGDRDNDTLADDWEQQIVDADPFDAILTIADVRPEADFDGDGLTNAEEYLNETNPTEQTEIIADITPMTADNARPIIEAQRLTPFRMNLQLRIRSDLRPLKLVRDVTIMVNGGGRFDETRVLAGNLIHSSAFPGRVLARTDNAGQFAIAIKGILEGRVAFRVEQIAGGGGVIPPSTDTLTSVQAPFLTAVWKGRQLTFEPDKIIREIRIADFAAAMYDFSSSADANWSIGGKTFQYITISQQGYVFLGREVELPAASFEWAHAPVGLFAPFWDKLMWKNESRIYINWDWLTEPYLTIEWSRMGHASDPNATLTFQVQIWQCSGQMRFVYRNLFDGTGRPASWSSANVGFHYGIGKQYTWNRPLQSFSAVELIDTTIPFVNIWDIDSDQDRLSKFEEEQLGTDPNNWDSDFDLMSDGWEHTFMPAQSPLLADAFDDADHDGYLNIIEYYRGSKPNNAASIPTYRETNATDTDNDGMPDQWELTYGLAPTSPEDALFDSDGDRYRNVLEYEIGGNPTDRNNHGHHPFEPEGGSSYEMYP